MAPLLLPGCAHRRGREKQRGTSIEHQSYVSGCSIPDSPVLDIDVCLALLNQHLNLHIEEYELVKIRLECLLQVERRRQCFC